MRKAFETNVPRLKPRLRSALGEQGQLAPDAAAEEVPAAVETPPAAPVASAPAAEEAVAPLGPGRPSTLRPSPGEGRHAQDDRGREAPAEAKGDRSGREPARASRAVAAPAAPPPARTGDVVSRRDRLEKIKRKVAEAARPAPRLDPVPADPARAAESVLSLVGELEAEVSRAREREEALRGDLDGARAELARAAGEARGATERLALAEQELTEKRGVLSELLAEMEALEQERDEAVRRAQALSALDEERARILEDVTRRAEEEAKLRIDREAEVERLGEELRNSAADGARLRTAVGELARERDQLAGELDRIRGERDELVTAKRALEQVHAALAQARAKLG